VVVVDASAILDLLLAKSAAPALRERLSRDGEKLNAPHLIDLEIVRVLRRYTRFGDLEEPRARALIDVHLHLPIERHAHESFLDIIWALRNNFSAYDAMYVALGITLSATLITSDAPLARAAAPYLPVEVFA
jgi:predicted nucleic acid-binding protein